MLCGNISTEMVEYVDVLIEHVIYFSLIHPFSITSANFAIYHILLKIDSLDYIFVADTDTISLSSSTLTIIGPTLPNLVK